MLSVEILKCVECAIPHDCIKEIDPSKRCIQCEINYSFIALEPITLKCGHHICKECRAKLDRNSSCKCKICSSQISINDGIGTASEVLIQTFMKDLTRELKEKYVRTLNLFTECKENAENRIFELKNRVKEDVNTRMKVLMSELELLREQLLQEVDNICDSVLKRLDDTDAKSSATFHEKANELTELIQRGNIEKMKFYSYQKSLKEMLQKIQRSFEMKLDMHFTPSEFHFNTKTLFGELSFDSGTIIKKQTFLASASADKSIKIWSIESGECVKSLTEHSGGVRFIRSLKKGLLASASYDKTIKIWDLASVSCIANLEGHTSSINALDLIDDNLLASGSEDGTINIWDLKKKTLSFSIANADTIWCLKLVDPHVIATAGPDKKIQIWDLRLSECIFELAGHKDGVNDLISIAPGMIASGSDDKTIRIWDLKTKSCVKKIDKVGCGVNSMNLVEPHVLAGGCDDGKIRLWDLKSGNLIETLTGHSNWVWCLKLLEPGLLVSGSEDKTIKIWNLETRTFHTLWGHESTVFSLEKVDID